MRCRARLDKTLPRLGTFEQFDGSTAQLINFGIKLTCGFSPRGGAQGWPEQSELYTSRRMGQETEKRSRRLPAAPLFGQLSETPARYSHSVI